MGGQDRIKIPNIVSYKKYWQRTTTTSKQINRQTRPSICTTSENKRVITIKAGTNNNRTTQQRKIIDERTKTEKDKHMTLNRQGSKVKNRGRKER